MSITTKSQIRFAALVALASLGMAACGDGSPTEPAPKATLELRNGANVPIVEVLFSRCTDEEWGADRLGPSETIAPGATRTWNIEPGCWDVAADTGQKTGYWYDREVQDGGAIRVTLSSAANASIGPLELTAKVR